MADPVAHVFCQVQRWISTPQGGDASDAVLLERFIQHQDEAAFAALVARHSAMVLRSCRRVLGDVHEAEDAFQASFLILARKARSLKQPEALSGWLYGVARRVALKARTKSAGRSLSATPLDEALLDPRPDPLTQLTARELLDVLDEEIQRLPAAQRSPFVLCCLEGRTQEEAARILGATPGSVKGRLERGRRRLHTRLARRGIALPAALAIVAASRGVAVSALLRQSAVRVALGGAAGSPTALAESVLKGMFAAKLAGVTALVLTMALGASSVALVYRSPAANPPDNNPLTSHTTPKKAKEGKPETRVDALGDPLPAGAIARLGTVRFRHGQQITFLAFTPDGKRLLSQGEDGVREWDAATGKELRHLTPEAGRTWGTGSDLSPDGKQLVLSSHTPAGPFELWDVDSGKKIDSLGERLLFPTAFISARFSPDGKLLATISPPTTVNVWDLGSRKKLRSWQAHPKWALPVTFSADSRKLLTRGSAGEVRLWDVATGRQLREFKPLDWKADETRIYLPMTNALSPDGGLLATIETNEKYTTEAGKVAWKTRINLRDTTTGKQTRLLSYPAYEVTPGQALPLRGVAFTPDGKALLTAGPDRFIRFWDPDNGKELRRLPLDGFPASLALSRDGKKLAVPVMGNMAIRVLDLKRGQPTTPSEGHLSGIMRAVLTSDGRTAVTGAPLEPLLVWDTAAGRVRQRLEGHKGFVLTLQLSTDGRTLFTSGLDKTLRIWDLATGRERRRITVERDLARLGLSGLALTPDGKTLAVVDSNKMIRVLDVGGEERQHFQGPEQFLGMGLTPDGRSLIAWSGDYKVGVWDTATGRKLREYPLPQIADDRTGHAEEYYNACLSPDGRLLAMGPMTHAGGARKPPGFLILKDLATGHVVHRIDNFPSETALVAFSPDGRTLAWTGFNDNAIRLLEVASGRERRLLTGHRGQVTALAFSADGRRLLSGCNDTTALVWNLASRSPATLTAAEVEALWADLAGADAAHAYRAIHQLAAAPQSTVPLLRKRLQSVAPVDEKRVARLLADLDSEDFAVRQKATAALRELADQPFAAYRKALEGKPSLETRRRLEDLLEKAASAWWDVSGERLRSLRAVEALELAGTRAAREALASLAAGAPEARLTEQARAARERLANNGQR